MLNGGPAQRYIREYVSRSNMGEIPLQHVYTPLDEAKEEIWKRWNDRELRARVEAFIEGGILEVFGNGPKGVLSRYITSPNFEFFDFMDLAKAIDLEPLCLEYSDDRLVAKNSVKYYLCKLYFVNGEGRNRGKRLKTLRMVDFNKSEGKRLNEIRTLQDEGLVEFHHRILNNAAPGNGCKVFDFSRWFNRTRNLSKEYYYLHYLALFICNGVLFENFLTNKEEMDFTNRKLLPSFHRLVEIFGVKPLIVPFMPFEDDGDPYWGQWYPDSIRALLRRP